MKILYITRAFGPNKGGMERLSYELSRALNQLPNCTVQVLAHRGHRLLSPWFNITALPKTLKFARTADVILLGDPILSFLGYCLKKMTSQKIAILVHGLDVTYSNILYQLYLRLFFRCFDLYLPISNAVNTKLERISMAGRKVVVTPGISDRFYNPNLTKTDLANSFPGIESQLAKHQILLTVGRLVKRKGHAWFIKNVIPHLPEKTIYLIAGTGPEATRLQRLAEKGGRVILLGSVSDAQLKTLYNTADAFIQPNISIAGDIEGFGLVVLEAALCDLPVFASNIDGIPNAIQHNQNGILLPPNMPSAWIKALNNHLAQPAQSPLNPRAHTLKNHTWPHAAIHYREAIESCL